MQLNKKKSGVLAIRADGRTRPIRIKSFDSIPVLQSYCYLGMLVSDSGRFSNYVSQKHKDLRELTKRVASTFRDIPDTTVKWQIQSALVNSKTSYGFPTIYATDEKQ